MLPIAITLRFIPARKPIQHVHLTLLTDRQLSEKERLLCTHQRTGRLRPVADVDVLSNKMRMFPFRMAIRQRRLAVLALVAALGACQPNEIVCRNTNWNWTHRPFLPEPVVDVILVTRRGSLLWNSTPVSWSQLINRLNLKSQSNVKPTTLLRHEDGADCARLASVRGQIARSLDCSSGECAEGHDWNVFPNNGLDGFSGGEQEHRVSR